MLPRKRQSRGTPFTSFRVGPAVATNEERTSDARSIALMASLQCSDKERSKLKDKWLTTN